MPRRAASQFLSQYPAEAEVLLGPLTGLEALQVGRIEGGLRHFVMRPTVNQRAVYIEEMVRPSLFFVLGSPHAILIELRQALISYQDNHMLFAAWRSATRSKCWSRARWSSARNSNGRNRRCTH